MCQIFAFKKPYRLALESNVATSFRYTIIKGNKEGKVGRVIDFFLFDFLNAPDERTWALAFKISIDCPLHSIVHTLGVFAKEPTCHTDLNWSVFLRQVQITISTQSAAVVMKTLGTNTSFRHWTNSGMCIACVAVIAGRHSTKGSVSFARGTYSARLIFSGEQWIRLSI